MKETGVEKHETDQTSMRYVVNHVIDGNASRNQNRMSSSFC